MKSTNYSTVLFNALQYSGLDRHNITDETFAQFRDFINERLRMAWDMQDWPDLIRVAQLTVVNDGNGLVTCDFSTDTGDILNCYDRNPLASTRSASLSYRIYDTGTNNIQKLILPTDPGTVWGEYRVKRTELIGELYLPTQAYSIGAQVYFDSGSETGTYTPVTGKAYAGNFYQCVATTNAGDKPVSSGVTSSKWELVQVPYVMASFAARGAFADWLKSEMQIEAAQVAEQEAQVALIDAVDVIMRQQKQINRLNMNRTY